ncbi:molybdate ABC transporter substrate-binding protein [Chiayiivirga flava]|uniref:Molybdate transport system substrate-binding protein n=1 Tax=Chiayiivirga flava TaxID=659595 RepID=A0A7W8G1V6_9GAMM|nr:molybdate ABC transporter substrate-binding protein [Chiayiivirga flava]MBB5209288.1 molybdate transport system substrate-binding protein [Chiayiivirga flava]
MRASTGFRRALLRAAVIVLALLPLAAPAADEAPLTVFAAASLKGALDTVASDYAATGRAAPRVAYAATSALARQIEQGAPADVFLSADSAWMDTLQNANLVEPATRHDLLRNTLVLVAPADAGTPAFALGDAGAWTGALAGGRLAVARVDGVPAGRYARAALLHLGVWSTLEESLAQTDDVRQALMFVARGEAPLGIVYRTDALAEPKVRELAAFPAASHAAIVYPVAAVKRSDAHRDTAAFLAYLQGDAAAAVFREAGFDLAR